MPRDARVYGTLAGKPYEQSGPASGGRRGPVTEICGAWVMTIATGLVLVVTVVVIGLLLLAVLRPRRPRLVNRGRRPRGYRWRRVEAMKAAAARDIALVQGKEPAPAARRGRRRGRLTSLLSDRE